MPFTSPSTCLRVTLVFFCGLSSLVGFRATPSMPAGNAEAGGSSTHGGNQSAPQHALQHAAERAQPPHHPQQRESLGPPPTHFGLPETDYSTAAQLRTVGQVSLPPPPVEAARHTPDGRSRPDWMVGTHAPPDALDGQRFGQAGLHVVAPRPQRPQHVASMAALGHSPGAAVPDRSSSQDFVPP